MSLKNQTIEAVKGEDFTYRLGPFTDSDSAAVDLTGATITWKLTTTRGGGTESLTKTTASGITIEVGGTYADVSIDGSADTDSLDPGRYWHEARAVLSGGQERQLVTASDFLLNASAL